MPPTEPPPYNPAWGPSPIATCWDDLLEGITSPGAWAMKREAVRQRSLALLRDEAAPAPPAELDVRIEDELQAERCLIQYISYPVEADERAYAYLALPRGPAPPGGFPAVLCLHGTTNWGARRTLGLPPPPDDPHITKPLIGGKDYARRLVQRGYVTLSPEHFCSGKRVPAEGPFDTAAFYRKHPDWSAVGKATYEHRIACSLLCARPEVNAEKIGVTGHSLGGQGSLWLAAYDDRIRCVAPSCAAPTFRQNPQPYHWSRDFWYIYFPQLREPFLAGETIPCDFHEMMGLIAPRPFMERFALNDGHPLTQAHRTLLHLKIHELYHLLDADAEHAFLVFGDGHAIPTLSMDCLLSWMDRWLKHAGNPLPAEPGGPERTQP